jgi:hypothetical protein
VGEEGFHFLPRTTKRCDAIFNGLGSGWALLRILLLLPLLGLIQAGLDLLKPVCRPQ